ncbi:MAG: TetR/AcrR family transcriptional regulator [Solirubrobacteraceae bacterium]
MSSAGVNGRKTASESSRRSRPSAKKREQEILDAAAAIFHRQGYADASVQEVADAVGILKGSLYYYIDSKEDLLFRMLVEVHEGARGIVDDIDALEGAPLYRLAEYIRRHIEYNSHNLSKIAVYYHDFELLTPARRKLIVKQRALYEEFVVGLLHDAQRAGEIDRGLEPKLVANAIFGAVNWIYTWYRPDGPESAEHLGRLYAELLISGLVGAKAPKPPRTAAGGQQRKSRSKAATNTR